MNTEKRIKRIEERYNADFDTIPDGPAVTWAEMTLAQAIKALGAELEDLRDAINTRLEIGRW